MTSPDTDTSIAQWTVLIAKAAALGAFSRSDELDTTSNSHDRHPREDFTE